MEGLEVPDLVDLETDIGIGVNRCPFGTNKINGLNNYFSPHS